MPELMVLPARSGKPRDKAKVEQAVQMVERWVVAPLLGRVFDSIDAINEAIKERLSILNQRSMQEYGISRSELFEQEEQSRLRPLPALSFIIGYWKRARVHSRDYHIQIEHHWYSVPHELVGKEVWAKVSDALIEVFLGSTRVASHQKSPRRGRFTTDPAHMPDGHSAYRSQRSKESFLSWAKSVGPETEKQVLALFERPKHEEQAFRSILGLQRLAKIYGACSLEAASARANQARGASYSFVKRCIELNSQEMQPQQISSPVNHGNIRGAGYYH